MNSFEDNTYATTYLPFAVTLPSDVKAYIGTIDEGNSKVTVSEVSGTLPAANGYILEGPETTAVLTIADADATTTEITSNDITGSYTSTANNADSYRIFSGSTGTLGFYKSSSGTLAANKAYIVLSESSAVQGLKLDFGTVDGITAVETEDAQTENAVYDLSGRSVKKATKGLYILNGKKVYIK